jgi:hypothetical protein
MSVPMAYGDSFAIAAAPQKPRRRCRAAPPPFFSPSIMGPHGTRRPHGFASSRAEKRTVGPAEYHGLRAPGGAG